MMPKTESELGFHLLEVMLIVFVMSLLIGLGWPLTIEITKQLEQEMFLYLLSSDFRYAQAEAMSKETDTHVQLDPESRMIRVVQGGKVLNQTPIPIGYHLKGNTPKTGIVFRETGQVVGGTIDLYRSGKIVGKLILSVASGRPRVVINE